MGVGGVMEIKIIKILRVSVFILFLKLYKFLLLDVLIFLGVFWGQMPYALHVFFVRGVIKYHEISFTYL